LLQALRVVGHLVAVAAHRTRQLFELVQDPLDSLALLAEGLVQLLQGSHVVHHGPKLINHRALSLASLEEQAIDRVGQQLQPLGVGQQRTLASQLGLLGGLQSGGTNLVHLKGEQVHPTCQLSGVLLQRAQCLAHLAQPAHRGGQLCALLLQPAIAIEEIDVPPCLQQRELIPLAVDVDQVPPEVAQHALRHRATVDTGGTAAAGAHFASDDQLAGRRVGVVEQPQCPELFLQGGHRLRRQLEQTLDGQPIGAGTHEVGGRACPQEQTDRVDDDRLASAGLTRKHVEPSTECQL